MERRMEVGYKLMGRDTDGQEKSLMLHSTRNGHSETSFCLPYHNRQWAYGDNGPLMLFKDYGSLTDALSKYYNAVWSEAYYLPIAPKTQMILPVWWGGVYEFTVDEVRNYWMDPHKIPPKTHHYRLSIAPRGTVFAAAISIGSELPVTPLDDLRLAKVYNRYSRDSNDV